MCAKRLCLLFGLFLMVIVQAACGQPKEQDPAAVIQAFYDAANAKDLDAFMALVADDAEIEWGRGNLVTGKEEIQNQAQVLFRGYDVTFEVSDFQVDGNRVSSATG